MTPELEHEAECWRNEDLYNDLLHSRFTKLVNETLFLKEHRDWTEANQFGFGDRAFGWFWKLLVDAMPESFTFLEVGVFKGQILSLVALLAKESRKQAKVFGITTLTNTEDTRCKYPAGDYAAWIYQIHEQFRVTHPVLIVGKSNSPTTVEQAKGFAPYDCCYVDGSHDYPDVVFDIKTFAPMVKVGGFLVMDDSSINRLNIGSAWPGLEDVSQAVKDHLDNNERFKFMLACGHINLFRRVL